MLSFCGRLILFSLLAAALAVPASRAAEPVFFVEDYPNDTQRPFVEAVFPPVLQRGVVNRVTLRGYGLQTAEALWTSVPGITISVKTLGESRADAVVLDVDVPAAAPLGLFGLRLAARSGLSNVHIFLIDELPATVRTTGDEAMPLTLPACVAAPCRATAIDRYTIEAAAGEVVSFEVIGNRLGKDYDPLVTIRDASGRMLRQCDNSEGLHFDCRFSHRFEAAGQYTVEVSDSRYFGNPYWSYVLRVGLFPAGRVVMPSSAAAGSRVDVTLPEVPGSRGTVTVPQDAVGDFLAEVRTPEHSLGTWTQLTVSPRRNEIEAGENHTLQTATPVTFPADLHGVLSQPGEEDWFSFELKKGETFQFQGVSRAMSAGADLELALFGPDGKEAARADDHPNKYDDANLTFTARQDGVHSLLVRDVTGDGGPGHAYRIEVRGNEPELAVAAEVDRFTLPRGNWQPLPLKVTRTRFAGPVKLKLLGAPAGVRIEPDVIPADQNEIVCRLIADDGAALGLATLQIQARGVLPAPMAAADGTVPAAPPDVVALATVQPLIDRLIQNKDRQIFALREDQRRLPPSLTTRIAVQVIEAIGFDVQPVDELVLLPKYQTADFRIITQRKEGFAAPIHFHTLGGQIGDEAEERNSIFCRIPDATSGEAEIAGRLHTRILMRYEKFRMDLSATARDGDHYVTLFRTFTVDAKSAFNPAFEPAVVEVFPGETVKFKALAGRVPTFDGAIRFEQQQPQFGIDLPETFDVPAGVAEAEFELKVNANVAPRRYSIRFRTTGYVGRYEEAINGPVLQVEVKKPPEAAKP